MRNTAPTAFLRSSSPVQGRLEIYLRNVEDGTRSLHFEEDNLIVASGLSAFLRPLYQASVISDPISSIHVGTGGTIDPGGLYPKTPTIALTSLYTDIFSVPTTYSVSGVTTAVTFFASLSETEGNGNLINEAGMFTTGNIMFNIKTFTGIPKTSSFAIDFVWTITVTGI